MGLAGAISHKLLSVVIKAVIIWIAFMFIFKLPVEQAGWVMICAFIAEMVGGLIASLLIRGVSWGQ